MTDTTTSGVSLNKGERFNLTKGSGGASDFYIGLQWDTPAATNSGAEFDLDASIFGCTYDSADDPKLLRDDYFVYYGRAPSPGAPFESGDGSIKHSGDNRTGAGDGDDEQIRIYLNKLDPRVQELSIICDIYDAQARGQNFGQVRKGKIRICKMDSAGNPTEELAKFNLSDDFSAFTAVQPGSIYKREDGDWAFNATGAGFAGGLSAAIALYSQ